VANDGSGVGGVAVGIMIYGGGSDKELYLWLAILVACHGMD
jgi:hypothetical protein